MFYFTIRLILYTLGMVASCAAQNAPAVNLPDGTAVKVRFAQNVSSGSAKVGDVVNFEVTEDVKLGDFVVIAQGAAASGIVSRAKPKGRMKRGGQLEIEVKSVKLVSGETAQLRGAKESTGGGGNVGRSRTTALAMVTPAAAVMLFGKGKDITIPKGTVSTAYLDGSVTLDATKLSKP